MVSTGWIQPTSCARAGSRATPPPRALPRSARHGRVLLAVEAAAREADLALVRPHGRRAPRQDEPGLACYLPHHGENAHVHVGAPPDVDSLTRIAGPSTGSDPDAAGHRAALAHEFESVEHTVRSPILVRRDSGTSPRVRGSPGRQVAGRGITWGGTGRDISVTLPAKGTENARANSKDRGLATLSPHDVSGRVAGTGRHDRLVPHHRPRQRGRDQGHRRPGDRGRSHPRCLGANGARYRCVGRKVLLSGREGRSDHVVALDHYTWGVDFVAQGRVLGRVRRERDLPRPVTRRDRLLAARPPGTARVRTGRGDVGLQGGTGRGRFPDSRPRRAGAIRRRPLPRRAVPHEGAAHLPRAGATPSPRRWR